MSHQKLWLLDNRVCFIDFSAEVTLEDVAEVSQSHQDWLMQTTSSKHVHYLLNMNRMKTYPRNVFAINNALRSQLMQTGWMIVITQDYMVKYIADIFGKKFGFNVKSTDSAVNGYRFLQEVDDIPAPQRWITGSDDTMPVRAIY